MRVSISNYLFPIFALFVIFCDELFYTFFYVVGTRVESGMMADEATIIAIIAYAILIVDIINNRITKRNIVQLFVLFTILVLYYITGIVNPYTSSYENYFSALLSYGALCVPACLVGIRLSRSSYNERVLNVLPFFLIVVVFIVGYALVTSSSSNIIIQKDEYGFSYQDASYYLSFCYAYCALYVFFYKKSERHRSLIIPVLMFILMCFCAIGCFLGGGRGAFVYLVAITIFLIIKILSKGKGHIKISSFLLLFLASAFLLYFFDRYNLVESVGVNRLRENLTQDDIRVQLWSDALKSFLNSPIIGHGIGSIWWTVGVYSHNLFTDLLAETGLLGTLIIVTVLVSIFISLIKRSKNSSFDLFLLLLFIGAIVHDSFSGYWISSHKLFLLFGYVYGMGRERR